MENTIISIVLTLFILSLITEQVSDFLKIYFIPQNPEILPGSVEYKIREQKIHIIAFITGITVAIICNANFFELIRSGGTLVPWSSIAQISFSSILGSIITGIFLGQGSKFFHDLLNIVIYFKNTQRSLYNIQEQVNKKLNSNTDINTENIITSIKIGK